MTAQAKDPKDVSKNFNICLSRRQHKWLADQAKKADTKISILVRQALANTFPKFPAGLE